MFFNQVHCSSVYSSHAHFPQVGMNLMGLHVKFVTHFS